MNIKKMKIFLVRNKKKFNKKIKKNNLKLYKKQINHQKHLLINHNVIF